MYTAALLDLHRRTHLTLTRLLQHCAPFSAEELTREHEGFGYANLREQLSHVIGAEEYWLSVVLGTFKDDPQEPDCPTVEALEEYRRRVAAITEDYLRRTTDAELNTAREMWAWPGKMRSLVPALVILRTQTHIYQHQGQVLAICRLLGRPSPGNLDFPLDPELEAAPR